MTDKNEAERAPSPEPMPVPPLEGSGVAPVHPCSQCAPMTSTPLGHLYAIGKLEARFPSLGIEREFQQRLASTAQTEHAENKRQVVRRVLENYPYLALRMCYVLMVSGYPAYIVKPAGSYLRESLFTAIGEKDHWCSVIGSVGPMATPDTCQGVLAPIAVADQIYAFSTEEWLASLKKRLKKALDSHKIEGKTFDTTAPDLFERVIGSTENLGATDAHRALNYAVMQHPGIFLAAAQRIGRQTLDRIETRLIRGLGPRRIVAIVLTFLDISTGVPERLFCRIDITEEWPFVAGEGGSTQSPLGLMPFVENELFGLA
ncbi:MAG: hypothetical protein KC588_10035 [Nitrospira sp.]|nr:hypothetical protein [Nitrospira sp.]